MNILFVCRGNLICSPLAEALLKKKYADHRINGEVDSAGFETFNVNEPPHVMAVEVGKKHGLKLAGKARLFAKSDFIRFDKIYVLDELSYHDVMELTKTKAEKKKVDYLMHVLNPGLNQVVPDPIYNGVEDFESVYTLLDEITEKMIRKIK